jgi:hypothetical protein
MTWLHYTSTEITNIKTYFDQRNTISKPNGLWCSYNDEWMEWCTDNGFFTFDPNNHYLYEVKLKPDANILMIDSFVKYICLGNYKDPNKYLQNIANWNMLKDEYDGIAFLNYQKIKSDMLNLGTVDILILSLDVSSCCIWNPVYELVLINHIKN